MKFPACPFFSSHTNTHTYRSAVMDNSKYKSLVSGIVKDLLVEQSTRSESTTLVDNIRRWLAWKTEIDIDKEIPLSASLHASAGTLEVMLDSSPVVFNKRYMDLTSFRLNSDETCTLILDSYDFDLSESRVNVGVTEQNCGAFSYNEYFNQGSSKASEASFTFSLSAASIIVASSVNNGIIDARQLAKVETVEGTMWAALENQNFTLLYDPKFEDMDPIMCRTADGTYR